MSEDMRTAPAIPGESTVTPAGRKYRLALADPAPLPCTDWCTKPAHREGTWEHLDAIGKWSEQRVSASSTCEQVIGTVDWSDEPNPERPYVQVTARRFQIFESGEHDDPQAEPATVELQMLTDRELPPDAARSLSRLLTVAADRIDPAGAR